MNKIKEDLSTNCYQNLTMPAFFEDYPGLGADMEPGRIWTDEINVEVLEKKILMGDMMATSKMKMMTQCSTTRIPP